MGVLSCLTNLSSTLGEANGQSPAEPEAHPFDEVRGVGIRGAGESWRGQQAHPRGTPLRQGPCARDPPGDEGRETRR